MPTKRVMAIKWRREVEWVYRNMEVGCRSHVQGKDKNGRFWCEECLKLLKRKPSKGAIALWKAAKEDPIWFLETFVARMASPKDKDEEKGKDSGTAAVGDCLNRLDRWWAERQAALEANGKGLRED
jgi:hypothetical protein